MARAACQLVVDDIVSFPHDIVQLIQRYHQGHSAFYRRHICSWKINTSACEISVVGWYNPDERPQRRYEEKQDKCDNTLARGALTMVELHHL